MKVLVTGGAGFLGTALVTRLADFSNVVVIDALDPQVHRAGKFSPELSAGARCIVGDVRTRSTYPTDLGAIDVVVHLAAQTGTAQSMYELSRYTSHNVGGTAALLEWLTESHVAPTRIILASSRAVYGDGVYRSADGLIPATRTLGDLRSGVWDPIDRAGRVALTLPMRWGQPTVPTSVYGLTKLWQEQLVESVCVARGIDYSILRFQNVFGPGQTIDNPYTGVIGYLTGSISAGHEVELFEDGLMTRDFVFVDDAARALEAAVKQPGRTGATVDVGSGVATTLKDLASMIGRISGRPARARISGRFRTGDVRHAVADRSAFDETFGPLACTPLEIGLERYYEWFRAQGPYELDRHHQSLRELQDRGLLQSARDRSRSERTA